MSSPLSCCTPCPTPTTINTPGAQGQSAFTNTSASFVVPALGAQIQISVVNSDWVAVGEHVFIPGAGLFEVISIPSSTLLLLEYVNVATNVDAGATIASGTIVTPSSAAGADGASGGNSFTLTTADFVIPAVNANVSNPDGFIHVSSTAFMGVGQTLFVTDGTDKGSFQVVSITNGVSFVAKFLGFSLDSAPGATIGSGATVSPGGTQPSAASITALTDNSTGTASNTIAAGAGVSTVPIAIQLASMTTGAADLITTYTPGYAFKILSISFAVTTLGTGAAASQILNMEIGATDLTGGVLTLLLADATPLGKVTNATAITALNVGTAADTISIEVAAGGTVFTAGAGVLLIKIQNMDTANAIASLADHTNDVIDVLTP